MAYIPFLNNAYFTAKVGIGTAGPSQIFEVSTTDYGVGKFTGNTDGGTGYVAAVVEIESNSNGRGRGIYLTHRDSTDTTDSEWYSGVPYTGTGYTIGNAPYGTSVNSDTGPAVLAQSRFFIHKNGDVGIGTTTPDQKLTVEGNIELGTGGYIYGDTTTPYLRLNNAVGTVLGYGAGYISLGPSFTYSNASGELFRIQSSNGDVGINTTSPDFKLDVEGTFGVSDLPDNLTSVSALVADEITGPELITNGDFENGGANWNGSQTSPATVTFSGGKATIVSPNGESAYRQQSILVPTNTYKATVDIVVRSGSAKLQWGTGTNASSSVMSATGSYVFYKTIPATNADALFYIARSGACDVDFDNVSVKQVTSASNQIQKRELGTGAFGPTPVGSYLPLAGGTMTGDLKLNDNVDLYLGTGNDFQAYHDGSNTYLRNLTGDLFIRQDRVDASMIFQCDDGAGGLETYFQLEGASGGASPFTVFPDSSTLAFGSGHDMRLYHNNGGFIDNYTGVLQFTNYADDSDIVFRSDNGSGGVENYIQIDGSEGRTTFNKTIRLNDNVQLQIGSSNDAYITHNGTNTYFVNGVGNLEITNDTNDGDIIFKCDNGSGGVSAYLTLDGSITKMIASKDIHFDGTVKATFGSNATPASIYYNGNGDVDTGTETVANVAIATYTAAFFDFVIKKGLNVRSGTVYACHDGDTTPLVQFTETSTQDLGDTSDVTLSVDISGTNMRLLATVTSDDWSVKSLIRAI